MKIILPDRGFNCAVKQIADRLFPRGFDVVADNAPASLEAIRARLETTGRFAVWSGVSNNTIFGEPEFNWCFRAWHDWNHHHFQFPFTYRGIENGVARMQQAQLYQLYGLRPIWHELVWCEVVKQAEYHELTGQFVEDQVQFAHNYFAQL